MLNPFYIVWNKQINQQEKYSLVLVSFKCMAYPPYKEFKGFVAFNNWHLSTFEKSERCVWMWKEGEKRNMWRREVIKKGKRSRESKDLKAKSITGSQGNFYSKESWETERILNQGVSCLYGACMQCCLTSFSSSVTLGTSPVLMPSTS